MSTADAIKKLHTSTIDTRRAYEKAEQETEDPNLKSFFAGMIALKQHDHDALHRVLVEMGEEADESGSFMTNVHQTVIGVRSAITGIDRNALSSFASGEENTVKEYDDALAQDDIHAKTTALLTRQKAALQEKIDEMKAMADR